MLNKVFNLPVLPLCIIGLLSSCLSSGALSDSVAQFTKDTTAIRSYITQNNVHATKLPSGVWFIIDSAAKGIRPTFNDTITTTYSMNILPSNAVADQSATPVVFDLSNLLSGIQYAMPQFQKGSKGRIFIPSFLGYQGTTQTGIPANSNLIFGFNLKDVKDYQLKPDTIAINNYLSTHSIVTISDPSGLHYSIDSLGAGSKPTLQDFVTINYTISLLSNGQIASQGSSTKFQLASSFFLGFQIGLLNIKEGSKCTLYIPSSLGYGSSVVSGIPVNSNLIFSIKVLKVSSN